MGNIAQPTMKLIQPLEGHVLIEITDKQDNAEDKNEFSTPNASHTPQNGKVVAIGKDTYYANTSVVYKCPVKIGDNIIHSGAGFEQVKEEDGRVKYRFIPFRGILGIK